MGQILAIIILVLILLTILFGLLFIPAVVTIIKMTYYEKIEGSVTDKEVKRIDTPDAGGNFAHYKYEFNYLGKTYEIEDKGYGYNKKLEVGNTVNIYIKKGHPDIYIYPNRVRDRFILLFLSLAGIIPLLIVLKAFLFDL